MYLTMVSKVTIIKNIVTKVTTIENVTLKLSVCTQIARTDCFGVKMNIKDEKGENVKYIDIHSHILPNMDDGSRSLGQSVSMLHIACEEGIGLMIATPHNMPGKGCPDRALVREAAERLAEQAAREDIPVKILFGTEYYYREEVLELLEAEQGITLGSSNCILVEFDPMVDRIYFRNALRNILATGYRPVVAHVERYGKVMEDISLLHDLKKMGILLQVNALSVTGENGRQTRKAVRKLLKDTLVDFVATDAHSDGRRAPYMAKCAEVLYRKYGRSYADALLFGNAERLIVT